MLMMCVIAGIRLRLAIPSSWPEAYTVVKVVHLGGYHRGH